MNIVVMLWAIATAVALVMLLIAPFVRAAWSRRRLVGECAACLLVAGGLVIAAFEWSWPVKLLLLVVQIWFVALALRLVIGRLDADFLRVSTQVNALLGVGLIALAACGAWLAQFMAVFASYSWRWTLLLTIAVAVGALALWQVLWTLRHYSPRATNDKPKDELPTVSVCIPARNEDHALAECLTAVLASDYPRLEVLVLDDCSQDATSHIIRSFAHDGVRFVQGDTPADGWLGKNQAMQTLAQHASGDFILFMSVDTLLEPQSISALMQYARQQELDMVSVLPQQRLNFEASTVFMPLRYAWQVALPVTARRVPVSSKAWLINADTLRELGGFASVAQKIIPEGTFARRLHTNGRYHFVLSNAALGITTAKRWQSQAETSLRLLYPTLKRQPLFALGAMLAVLGFLVLPFVVVAVHVAYGVVGLNLLLAATAALLTLVAYALILARTNPKDWLLGVAALPVVLLQEIGLIAVSMLQYEFGEVNWKGRNVCYPVISVPPRGFGQRPSSRLRR